LLSWLNISWGSDIWILDFGFWILDFGLDCVGWAFLTS
jgi:hypothetical protein